MTLAWTDFPGAPAPGTPLCAISDVPEGTSSINIGEFPVLMVQDSSGTRAFVNACPHQYLPLDQRGNALGADGARLICSNHDAAFDAQTGAGVSGFGVGACLSIIPLQKQGADWVIETT